MALLHALVWWFLRFSSLWVLTLAHLLYDLKIHGCEHFPADGPLILIIRHSSRIESVRLAFFCRTLKAFHGLAAGPLLVNSPLFAWFSRAAGMLHSFKGKGLSSAYLMEAYSLLMQGKIIVIGADGEVPWDGRPQSLQLGAAWLALRTRAPVIVTALQGAYDIWPRWASRPHLTGKLTLKISAPFYLCEAPSERVNSAMLREANERLVAELDALAANSRGCAETSVKEHA